MNEHFLPDGGRRPAKVRNSSGSAGKALIAVITIICVVALRGAADSQTGLEVGTQPKAWQIQGFVASLRDEDSAVLRETITASFATEILSFSDEAAKDQVPRIADLLKDTNRTYIRIAAVKALGAMGGVAKDQVPWIAELLKDPNPDIRAAVAEALGAMGGVAKDQVPRIADLLKDTNRTYIRIAAVKALGAMGGVAKDQVPRIAELLKDPNPDIRIAAVKALGAMGGVAKDQVPRIAELLKDPNPDIRAAAVEALGAMGGVAKDQVPRIAELLKDPNPDIRIAAVKALGAMGGAPQLADLLKDTNRTYIHIAAVQALGAMGGAAKDQVPRIAELLKDPNPDIRAAAVEALGAMGGVAKDQVPRIAELLKDPNPDIRAAAVEALGAMGGVAKDQVPRIADLLKDTDPDVCIAAVKALRAMGGATKDQVPRIADLLKDTNRTYIRIAAAEALGAMGCATKDQVTRIADLLKDTKPDVLAFFMRPIRIAAVKALGAMGGAPQLADLLKDTNRTYICIAAVQALGAMGGAAKDQVPRIAELLKDTNPDIRAAAAEALGAMGPFYLDQVLHVLSNSYANVALVGEVRFLAHFVGGDNEDVENVLTWLGRPCVDPLERLVPNHDAAVSVLKFFLKVWPPSEPFPAMRQDLANQIARVVNKVSWATSDIDLLRVHETKLREIGSTHAIMVQEAIRSAESQKNVSLAGKICLLHVLFWVALMIAYPRSPKVQAIFFWNPWIRRFIGLGYVGFFLRWIPLLRTRLFAPFKESLCADADLGTFDAKDYFDGSLVTLERSGCSRSVNQLIPEIKGQIVLEGDSGIGKTMFLRRLVCHTRRVVVYLPAAKCAAGIMKAIQAKLHGLAQDERFLRDLIYSGAVDIYIDGLNEVSADTRAKVTDFMERFFKSNILIGTQPLAEWIPPSTARTYVMQPLTEEQVRDFLLFCKNHLPEDARVSGQKYEQACIRYLAVALDAHQPSEVLKATRRVLSNPMDLTVVASILARGEQPDLFHLQEQQYLTMANDYRRLNIGREFPLNTFSERIYEIRLKDNEVLPQEEFPKEIQCLEQHKMVVVRQSLNKKDQPKKEYFFRHDKIADFFIVQTFLGKDNDRPEKHFADPRFRGVYLQLAVLLPLQDAEALQKSFIDYAVDSKDHMVSDSFIKLLRSRKAAQLPIS